MKASNYSLSPFSWSVKKLLDTEPDIANKARIRIIVNIIGFTVIKSIVLIPFAYEYGQYFQVGRAVFILILSAVLLKILFSNKANALLVSHLMILTAMLVIWTNMFFGAQEINMISVQMVFVIVVSSFYLLDNKFGTIYTVINFLTILGFLILYGRNHVNPGQHEELVSPAYEIVFMLNFITIGTSVKLFHDAFNINISEKEVLNSELQEAVSEATKLAKTKSDFLSTMETNM